MAGRYHQHPTHPYSHLKKTKHVRKGGAHRAKRRRSSAMPRRSARTGRFVRG